MSCPQCEGIDAFFDPREAERKLRSYHKNGPDKTTRMLLDAVKTEGVGGSTVLDIGGGIGAVQHGLLEAGASSAVSIDASQAYTAAARQEVEHQGLAERIQQRFGDFVDLAHEVEAADIVTLDRVICCYHDVERLVGLSSAKAKRTYAVVYPRDNWLFKLLVRPVNGLCWLRRSGFRVFIHSTAVIEGLVTGNGLVRTYYRKAGPWQVAVYTRSTV